MRHSCSSGFHPWHPSALYASDVRCVWQVVDFWAFSEEDWGKEIMSMHHTRNALQKSTPQVSFHDLNQNVRIQVCRCVFLGVTDDNSFLDFIRLSEGQRSGRRTCDRRVLCLQAGDTLYTASMKPIMTFLEDSGPGAHDTTAAACSYGLYVLQIGEVRLCSAFLSFFSGVVEWVLTDVLCSSSSLDRSCAGTQTVQLLLHSTCAEFALLQLHAH